jgi:crotonobetainyl-CoA:carnitine CoA-transferase CaiB-like acyl-CoA transferase
MAAIEAKISAVMAKLDREAAVALLNGAAIACGRLSTMDDLATHPQARRIVVDTPTGPVELMGRGTRYEGMQQDFGRVPALGEQGQRIREEFSGAGGRRHA